jgi:hypothetical protein
VTGPGIPVWEDRYGRAWLDTGKVSKAGQPMIELADGSAQGALDWVQTEFGPVEQLGDVTRRSRADRPPGTAASSPPQDG